VLFSNDQVAQFINRNFEATWETVREVPIVRIDFGAGNVLTRTLHGNILTSVCTADGMTLDALPGIYNPPAYLDQVDQFRLLSQNFLRQPVGGREGWIRQYHEKAVAAIKANQPPARFAEAKVVPVAPAFGPGGLGGVHFAEAKKIVPVGKGLVEWPTQQMLAMGQRGAFPNPPNGLPVVPAPVLAQVPVGTPEELAGWKALAEDTQLNETARRRQIHEMLAQEGLVGPAKVLKPIYKDVLHADLDDPYLGLGKTLFENYPFAAEDEKR
jgi:hypothetical protein